MNDYEDIIQSAEVAGGFRGEKVKVEVQVQIQERVVTHIVEVERLVSVPSGIRTVETSKPAPRRDFVDGFFQGR